MQTEFELLNSKSKGACLKGKLLLLPLAHSLYLDCLRSRQSRPSTAFYLRLRQDRQTDMLALPHGHTHERRKCHCPLAQAVWARCGVGLIVFEQ